MSWQIEISKVTSVKKGSVTVDGTAYGEGADAKVAFSGKYNAKDKEWEHFSSKTVNPEVIKNTPAKALEDVVREIADEVHSLVHEKEWS